MMRKNNDLPPEIRDDESGGADDAEEALAILAEALINPKNAKVMSIIKNDEELQKIWMMLSMSKRKPFAFLRRMAEDRLLLYCAVRGTRSQQVIKAISALGGGMVGQEKQGLSDRIKGLFERDFVDGGSKQ